jgi:hypothetical protein
MARRWICANVLWRGFKPGLVMLNASFVGHDPNRHAPRCAVTMKTAFCLFAIILVKTVVSVENQSEHRDGAIRRDLDSRECTQWQVAGSAPLDDPLPSSLSGVWCDGLALVERSRNLGLHCEQSLEEDFH